MHTDSPRAQLEEHRVARLLGEVLHLADKQASQIGPPLREGRGEDGDLLPEAVAARLRVLLHQPMPDERPQNAMRRRPLQP